MPSRKDELIEAAVEVLTQDTRPRMLEVALPSSCILATKIAVEACRGIGLRARPLPVRAHVFNPTWVERVKAGHVLTPDKETVKEWLRAGAHRVTVGFHGEEERALVTPHANGSPGWNGHLVAIIEESVLLDLALDQTTRPAHDMHVEPVAARPPRELFRTFVRGEAPLEGTVGRCTVAYEARPEEKGYLASPDWADRRRWEGFASASAADIGDRVR
jgi:hypothetical protein